MLKLNFTKKNLLKSNFGIIILSFICICLIFLTFNFKVIAQENQPNLIISEVSFGKSPKFLDKCNLQSKNLQNKETADNLCSYDKWIEIQNLGQTSINLNGYYLQIGKLQQPLKITQDLVIPSAGFGLISNKRVDLISVLDRIEVNNQIKMGFLGNLSNNTEGESYIKIALYRDKNLSELISKVEVQNLPTSKENEFASLEFCGLEMAMQKPKNNFFKLETQSFYGSPGTNKQCKAQTQPENEPIKEKAPAKNPQIAQQQIPATQPQLQPVKQTHPQLKTQPELQAQTQIIPETQTAAKLQPNLEKQIIAEKQVQQVTSNNVLAQNYSGLKVQASSGNFTNQSNPILQKNSLAQFNQQKLGDFEQQNVLTKNPEFKNQGQISYLSQTNSLKMDYNFAGLGSNTINNFENIQSFNFKNNNSNAFSNSILGQNNIFRTFLNSLILAILVQKLIQKSFKRFALISEFRNFKFVANI